MLPKVIKLQIHQLYKNFIIIKIERFKSCCNSKIRKSNVTESSTNIAKEAKLL